MGRGGQVMSEVICPNADCGSTGPFLVHSGTTKDGKVTYRVLQCPLCKSMVEVLEVSRAANGKPDHQAQVLRRLESAVRSVQSNMTHVRGQLMALQGKLNRKF